MSNFNTVIQLGIVCVFRCVDRDQLRLVQVELLSRQTESVRDHKFHSGYAHSSMDRRALYFEPASNSRVNRER